MKARFNFTHAELSEIVRAHLRDTYKVSTIGPYKKNSNGFSYQTAQPVTFVVEIDGQRYEAPNVQVEFETL